MAFDLGLRMAAARCRIIAEIPELRDFLEGRSRPRGHTTATRPPLERGLICPDLRALADLPLKPAPASSTIAGSSPRTPPALPART